MRGRRRRSSPIRLGCFLPWAIGLACGSAGAQVSGSVSLVSDERFRGVSLSDGLPAVQIDLGFDDASGWFGGLYASTVRLYEPGTLQGQGTGYAGYAMRLGAGWSADAGASYSGFTDANDYDYGELHVGLTTPALDARLSYAPNYFGLGLRTVYVEMNGSQAVVEPIRFVWHGGWLQVTSGNLDGKRSNADGRAGVEIAWRAGKAQLARVLNEGSTGAYPVTGAHPHGDWLATISYTF